MNGKNGLWIAVLLTGLAGCASQTAVVNPGGDSSRSTYAGNVKPATAQQSAETSQDIEPMLDLVALSRPPIPDLPVPAVFSLAESKSRSFEAAGARYIDHVYNGRGDKFLVKRFYERYMPVNHWSLVTDMFLRGDIQMDFEKETERCRITIVETGWFNSVQIRIAIWTSGPLRNNLASTDRRR